MWCDNNNNDIGNECKSRIKEQENKKQKHKRGKNGNKMVTLIPPPCLLPQTKQNMNTPINIGKQFNTTRKCPVGLIVRFNEIIIVYNYLGSGPFEWPHLPSCLFACI